MKRTKRALLRCYVQALKSHPRLAGVLEVTFTVAGEPRAGGAVASVRIADDRRALARHPTLRPCLARTMRSLRFPPPEQGGRVEISYPFTFSPD